MDQGVTPPGRVAIVGGGWAGLAAAVELASAGVIVTVFEAAKQLGGRARRVEVNGYDLDNGQHILIGAYRETLRLMRVVGQDPDRVLKRLRLDLSFPRAGFRLSLPHLPPPLNLAAGLFGARGCSFSDKVGAVRFVRSLQAVDYRIAEDKSVAELLDAYGQNGALRRFLWEPLCLAALNTSPDAASARIFANVLRDTLGGNRENSDLLLPTADLGRIFPDAAARFIEVHGGAVRLSARIETLRPERQIEGEDFDAAVVAVAPQHACRMLAEVPGMENVAARLGRYRYEPIGTVYVGYPLGISLPAPMLGLEGLRTGFGQWVFDRGSLTGTAGVLGFVLSAHGTWSELDNGALVQALHTELEEALDRKLPPPLWHRVIRERRATFSCTPGLARPAAQSNVAGIWLAGDYVYADYPATLEGAVRSGVEAARGILDQLGVSSTPQNYPRISA
ncbi:hydroxysqualene dehydroxylase HpnE [Propionivibrio soli]|uniref:hydroxysqualene dehydroxylase HpnE n=1 Tax=Propionivibrio soli TaxID=2976531 RepID=UPI0021E9104A|nr:hydroxysqualene dehydroxylase HpnE [Propionivibrio soli]